MTTEMNAEGHLQLSAVYSLLSHMWTHELSLEMLQAINEPELRSALTNLGGQIPEEVTQATIDELAIDYCQLLVGPKNHLSPVQSVWEERQLGGAPSSSMLRFAELLPGYNVDSSLPDHFGLQLNFMSELFSRAAVADHPETYDMIAQQFYEQHLRWSGPLLRAVAQKANTDFYRGLAKMTEEFLGTLRPEEN